ncbi:MAG: hypothetical protein MR449_05820 [Spirochaetia bacterium]|nr:hypothetical protein [Spirochaetia bacterium]
MKYKYIKRQRKMSEKAEKEYEKWSEEIYKKMYSPRDDETIKSMASEIFEPDEDFQDLYDMCRDESDFCHNGFHYSIFWGGKGFVICCQDLSNPEIARLEGFEEQIPYEYFKTRADLITQFKLKNDGRTLMEYWCDYFHKPRLLVPPTPTDYKDV